MTTQTFLLLYVAVGAAVWLRLVGPHFLRLALAGRLGLRALPLLAEVFVVWGTFYALSWPAALLVKRYRTWFSGKFREAFDL